MRTPLLCIVLAAALAVPQTGRTARQWTTIRDGDARLTAEFPAPPLRETQANGMVRWMVTLDNDHYAYIVGVIVIRPERMTLGVPRLLDDAVAGGVKNVPGGELMRETDITFQGYPGRELLMKAPGGSGGGLMRLVARTVIAVDRLYIVTAVGPFEAFDQREFDRFLASLIIS